MIRKASRVFLRTGVSLALALIFVSCAYSEDFSDKTDIVYKADGLTFPRTGTGQEIKVKGESFKTVVIQSREGTIEIPASDVERIEHFDAPIEFKLGIKALESKSFKQANDYFLKIKDFPRPWVKIYILFYRAEAVREWGRFDKEKNKDAEKLYEDLLNKYPDNIFKARAMLGNAVASIQAGKYKDAREKIEIIKKAMPVSRWDVLADLWLGRIHVEEGNFSKAASVYRRISNVTDDSEIKLEAQLGEIKSLAGEERYDDAFRRAGKLIESTDDPKILGSTWNVVGDCHLARAPENPEEIKRALMAYLRVVVVYFSDPATVARAAYGAAECFEMLKQNDRAVDLYTKVAGNRRGGDWTKKAEGRLKELR